MDNYGKVDFKSSEAVRMLTKALLFVDFGLQVELPEGRLCPTIANRLDYIHLIEDLLESTGVDYRKDRIKGLDIGTGASCIYPLLACVVHSNWSFIATEVDTLSAHVAALNITRNALPIQLITIEDSTDLFAPLKDVAVDFCMCNPPFYSAPHEATERRRAKQTDSSMQLEYSTSESVYEAGGEVAFVTRIIEGSTRLMIDRCKWYTSLLGLKSSVATLEEKLKGFTQVKQVKILPSQVGKTKRWILAWSFQDRTSRTKKRKWEDTEQNVRLSVELKNGIPDEAAIMKLLQYDLHIEADPNGSYRTTKKTWTRRAKRIGDIDSLEPCEMLFTFTVYGRIIEFVLLAGDRVEFNSLINHLRHRFCREH